VEFGSSEVGEFLNTETRHLFGTMTNLKVQRFDLSAYCGKKTFLRGKEKRTGGQTCSSKVSNPGLTLLRPTWSQKKPLKVGQQWP